MNKVCTNGDRKVAKESPVSLGIHTEDHRGTLWQTYTIIIIITINRSECDIKLQPIAEFRRGIMSLPFAATTSRSLLSKM